MKGSFFSSLLLRKPPERILEEAGLGIEVEEKPKLKRQLRAMDLIFFGIGAIVGAGIFSVIGTAAGGDLAHGRLPAGPGVIISFIIAAAISGLSALCYAEMTSMLPISGSAYTYAYASLGEFFAWLIGWNLILEYAVGNTAVAISWGDYLESLLRSIGINLPAFLTNNPGTIKLSTDIMLGTPHLFGVPILTSDHLMNYLTKFTQHLEIWWSAPQIFGYPIVFDLLAVLIVAVVTWIIITGIRESSTFNNVMVFIKLLVLGFFVIVGAFFVNPDNFKPFMPYGWKGVFNAAAIIFFAYIGFDALSTVSEETVEPQKNLPIGIIGSLVATTIIYIIVSLVLIGIVPYSEMSHVADPLALAFEKLGLNWGALIVSIGALVATTSVLLVFQLGQPRIFMVMARDGLLPPKFAEIHPKYGTPLFASIVTGLIVGIPAAFMDIATVAELTNIGTLFAFLMVSAAVIILRYKNPDVPRGYKVPFFPWLPILSMLASFWLMLQLPTITWVRFLIWSLAGLIIYFAYSYRHSKLRRLEADA